MKRKKAIACARAAFEWWISFLGLRWWRINVNYEDVLISDHVDSSYEIAGRCSAQWQYLSAAIDMNVGSLKTSKPDEIERIVVHELVHVLVNEMREEGLAHEERVTTLLTNAFIWVRDQARKEVERSVQVAQDRSHPGGKPCGGGAVKDIPALDADLNNCSTLEEVEDGEDY